MRAVAVVSVARSDLGLFRPILQEAAKRLDLRLRLFVAGSHLSVAHGYTVKEIEAEGWPIAARIETVCSDSPRGIASSMALAFVGFGMAWDDTRPDMILALGDRFETFCAVAAALPYRIPVIHLHGGEATEGLYDEAFRHAITKMSHLHLVSTVWAACRVQALGEEMWRVQVVGAPGLDGIAEFKPIPRAEAAFLPAGKFLLVVWHPETLSPESAEEHAAAVAKAVADSGLDAVWIGPGADLKWRAAQSLLAEQGAHIHAHLPRPQFWTAMTYAEALVGNSSAGIIEAASFGLPVVNVGDRQKGRLAPDNVVHVPAEPSAITEAIRYIAGPPGNFRLTLEGMLNPYGDGHAAARICDALEKLEIGDRLLKKRLEAL